jgi:hypothetical protein
LVSVVVPVEALNSGAYFYDVYRVLRAVVEAPRAPSILVLEDGSLSLFGGVVLDSVLHAKNIYQQARAAEDFARIEDSPDYDRFCCNGLPVPCSQIFS